MTKHAYNEADYIQYFDIEDGAERWSLYRKMARACGYWATARHMANKGFALYQTLLILGMPIKEGSY